MKTKATWKESREEIEKIVQGAKYTRNEFRRCALKILSDPICKTIEVLEKEYPEHTTFEFGILMWHKFDPTHYELYTNPQCNITHVFEYPKPDVAPAKVLEELALIADFCGAMVHWFTEKHIDLEMIFFINR